jgi:hypothetical protein
VFRRRTVVTFEKLERSRYYIPDANLVMALCPDCGKSVCWLTPNQMVALSGLSLRELFRRIEVGSVHFRETTNGLVLVCPDSITLTTKNDQTSPDDF